MSTVGAVLPEGEREYRFHTTRRRRFDRALKRVAVEIDGGSGYVVGVVTTQTRIGKR